MTMTTDNNRGQESTYEGVLGLAVLAERLHLDNVPPDLVAEIVSGVLDVVFKRLLLCVPSESTEEFVRTMFMIREKDGDLEDLLPVLRSLIPDFDTVLAIEIDRAIDEFRVSDGS